MTSPEPPRRNSLAARFANMRRVPLDDEDSVEEVHIELAARATVPAETIGEDDYDFSFAPGSESVPDAEPVAALESEIEPAPEAVLEPAPMHSPDVEPKPTPAPKAAPSPAARATRPSYESPHRRFGGRRPIARSFDSSRRTWHVIMFVPIFSLMLAVAELRLLFERISTRSGTSHVVPMHFERPPGMPDADHRSVDDVMATLESFPFDPLPVAPLISFNRQFGADSLSTAFIGDYSIAALPHRYPGHFHHRLMRGADGESLAALVGMQPGPAPALVICHGLMTTKNFDYIRRMAVRAYSWGFHVVTFDQRGWGDSSWTTTAPPTGGYLEGKDLLEIARALQLDEQVTSVGVMGYSMGASSALNAARWSSLDPDSPIDGGVLALSAPTMMKRAVEHISKRPHWRDPYFLLYNIFGLTVRRSTKYFGAADRNDVRWSTMVRTRSVPYYNIPEDEFYDRASAANWATEITVPTLEIHATDDFMVPVEHAFALSDAVEGNDNVRVWILDKGNHVSFEAVDQRWYFSVVRRWFEYWAEEPAATAAK